MTSCNSVVRGCNWQWSKFAADYFHSINFSTSKPWVPTCVTDEMSLKRNFAVFRNQIDHMPLYNRSHGQNKSKDDRDIALSTHKKQVFLEKEIKSEDTLQSIALEFNVSVAELKRINNIHKDNEIHARKVIKVPSNPFSLLLEKEYFVGNENPLGKIHPPAPEKCDVIVETVNNSNCIPKSTNEAPEQDKNSFSQTSGDEVHESVSLLSTTHVETKPNDVISCNGADWGISWPALILVTLVLGVGGPVLYVFWFIWGRKEKAEGS